MKKQPALSVAILVAVLLFAAVSSPGADEAVFTKHFATTLFAIGEMGRFSIEVLPDDREYDIGSGKAGIVVHDSRDRDVEAAMVEATVTGADGRVDKIPVKEKGEGLYTIPRSALQMGGASRLSIRVLKKGNEDIATFSLPADLARPLAKGPYRSADLRSVR